MFPESARCFCFSHAETQPAGFSRNSQRGPESLLVTGEAPKTTGYTVSTMPLESQIQYCLLMTSVWISYGHIKRTKGDVIELLCGLSCSFLSSLRILYESLQNHLVAPSLDDGHQVHVGSSCVGTNFYWLK